MWQSWTVAVCQSRMDQRQWLYVSLAKTQDNSCIPDLSGVRTVAVCQSYLIQFKAILIIKFLCQIAGQWLYASQALFLVVSVWCVAVCQAIVILKSSGSMPVQSCIVFFLFDKGFPLLHIYRGFFPFSQVKLK